MVCDVYNGYTYSHMEWVLILILLEYGLRQYQHLNKKMNKEVLILILLEYGLRPSANVRKITVALVLILILLEYGLRLSSVIAIAQKMQCLNPYSTGIWSATLKAIKSRCTLLTAS